MGDAKKYYEHNLRTLKSLCIGDLIEFIRSTAYSHWGVFLGNDKVAHLSGVDNDGINAALKPEYTFTICGVRFNKAKVCIDDFWTVAGESKAVKNNDKDRKWKPLNPDEIVNNALQKMGEIGYNLIFSNCEHFAKWCRYGISKSDQVENVITGAAVGAAVAATLGVIYAMAKFFNSDEEKEEKESHRQKQ